MKAIIILICIFTPPLGWILLVYLMHQWQREEALEKFIETGDRSDLKIEEGGTGEAIGDGILTGVLIILIVAGGLFLLVTAADAHDHIARWECDQRNCAMK